MFKCLVFKQSPNLALRALSDTSLLDLIQQDILVPQMGTIFLKESHVQPSLLLGMSQEANSEQLWVRTERDTSLGKTLCVYFLAMVIAVWGCQQAVEGAALCLRPAAFQGLRFRRCHQALVRNRWYWNTHYYQLWEAAAYPGKGNFSGTLRSSTFEWRGPGGLAFLLLASGPKGGSQPCHFIYG